jgi:dihydrofolate reductase/thymidylate synthase
MGFSVIAALDRNRGIGSGGKLPWNLKGDMKHFKEVTLGSSGGQNVVIMGRTTWDSIPARFRPLEGRINVVLSRSSLELPEGVRQVSSFDEALVHTQGSEQIFVIGGASVYAQAVLHPECQTLYLTEIDGEFSCDTFFPEVPTNFAKSEVSEPMNEGGVIYRFVTYQKK